MRRPGPTALVWTMTATLAVVGVLAPLVPARVDGTASWALVALFAGAFFASEAAIFHLEIRGQAHSFSLGTMALAVGLVVLGPTPLLIARVLGSGSALLTVRKLPGLKSSFNLALFAAEVTVAELVLHGVAGIHSSVPLAAAALAGVIAADITGVVAVNVVISIFEGRLRPAQLAAVGQSQLFLTLISGSLGVVGAVAYAEQAVNGLFVVAGAAGIVAVLRSHARLSQQHTSLSALYEFTKGVDQSLSLERLAVTAIVQATDVLAASVYIVILEEDGPLGNRAVVSVSGGGLVSHTLPGDVETWAALGGPESSRHMVEELGSGPRAFFGERELREVLVSSVDGGTEHPMLFVAAKPNDSVGSFSSEHESLLEAFGAHVSAIFRNGVLLERLREAALRDDLTRLPNLYALVSALEERQEAGVDTTLVRVGFDGLDDIIDALGHRTGDQVVTHLGRELLDAIDEGWLPARISGSEFGVLVDGDHVSGPEIALALCESLSGPVRIGELELDITMSAGVVRCPAAAETVGDPVREADVALSAARAGRERVVVYDPSLEGDRRRRLELVGRLRSAIESNSLQLWYQPKIDLATGHIIGAEALARWIDDEFGFVPPDEFIAVAEATGLIDPLTDRLLDIVMDQLVDWHARGIELNVALNLSSMNLLDESLPARVSQGLRRRRLPAAALSLEVTETAVMSDTERIIRVLDDLAARGLELSVDDYGTGYSSLSYLRRLPVSQLKIDRSFIMNLPDPQDEVIVRSTIELGHALGLRVVAEGVEEHAGFDCLRRLGCDYVQGYFIAKPLTAPDFEVFWSDRLALRAMLGYGDVVHAMDLDAELAPVGAPAPVGDAGEGRPPRRDGDT